MTHHSKWAHMVSCHMLCSIVMEAIKNTYVGMKHNPVRSLSPTTRMLFSPKPKHSDVMFMTY